MLEALSSSCEGGESRVIQVHRARCVVVLERCSYSKFDKNIYPPFDPKLHLFSQLLSEFERLKSQVSHKRGQGQVQR